MGGFHRVFEESGHDRVGGLQCRKCDEPEASNELGGGNDDENIEESVDDVNRDPEEGDEKT